MVKSEGLRRRVTPIAAGLLLAALLAVLVVLLWGERPAEAAFPGANGLIAYESDDGGIYVMNPSTGDRIMISDTDYDNEPAWSPDGQRIAFTSYRDSLDDEDPWRSEIYVMDDDPSTANDAINISNNASSSDRYPAWSPDGKKIAFVSDRDGDEEIYVMDTDPSTKDITRITKNDTWDASPDWSPNGQKIAFEGDSGIIVKNSDGSGRQRLPNDSVWPPHDPVWSPNGRKIAFTRLTDPDWGDHDIFVMNKDGSKVKRLTFEADYLSSPTWQPIVP